MEIQDFVVNLATSIKQYDFDTKLQIGTLKKAMDITETMTYGVIAMMDNVPQGPGAAGEMLDRYA